MSAAKRSHRAQEIWKQNWQNETAYWHSPVAPMGDIPLAEQAGGQLHLFRQQKVSHQTDGQAPSRIFAFDDRTGDSLTCEFDQVRQRVILNDPNQLLNNHEEATTKLYVEQKAKELSQETTQSQGGFVAALLNRFRSQSSRGM